MGTTCFEEIAKITEKSRKNIGNKREPTVLTDQFKVSVE